MHLFLQPIQVVRMIAPPATGLLTRTIALIQLSVKVRAIQADALIRVPALPDAGNVLIFFTTESTFS